jgi:hypothetical protein
MVSWKSLIAHSKAKLKNSGDKSSPCFRPFWIKKLRTLLYVFLADVTVTQQGHVTGSNDAILSEGGRTTAVSSVGVHLRPGIALGHSFGTPPPGPAGQLQSQGMDWYDQLELADMFP